jgi:hypothetical protein
MALIKVWHGTALTPSEIQEDHQNVLNELGSGGVSFLPNLTSKFLMDEVSGLPQDSIGAKHFTSVEGTPTYNGDSISYNGIDQAHIWNMANRPIQSDEDHTGYLIVTIDNKYLSDVKRLFRPVVAGSSFQGPWVNWDGPNQKFYAHSHAGSGLAQIDLSIGRDLVLGEQFALVWSYDKDTGGGLDNFRFTLSNGTINLSGNVTGTVTSGWNILNTESYQIAKNVSGNYTETTYEEIGFIKGISYSESDCFATAKELMNINTPPQLIFNSVQQR